MSNSVFKIKEDGVFLDEKKVCDYLKIVGFVKLQTNNDWKTRLEFKDMDGDNQIVDVENDNFSNIQDVIKVLLTKGFCPNLDSTMFKQYMLSQFYDISKKERFIEINKTGWTNDKFDAYICPSFRATRDESTRDKEKFILSQALRNCGFGQRGTLKEWQENICRFCENNENLTFVLCNSLGSIILKPLGLNGCIFHYVGRSSIGKTTLAYLGSSVWGGHEFMKIWRLTSNGLEGLAELHNDSTLVLDELSQASSRDAGGNLYLIANGSGKGRADKNGNPRDVKTWLLNAISTGEICMADKINESGEKVKGGQGVRAIDIYAEIETGFGIFNDLHSFSSGSEFSNYIKQQTNLYYGTAAHEFAKGVTMINSVETLRETYAQTQKNLYDKFNLKQADGQVQRVADYFAENITAGIFASSDYLGILTHNSSAIEEDVTKVFSKWLANRGSVKSHEENQVIDHIRGFLEMNQNRFKTKIHGIEGFGEAKSYNNSLGLLVFEENAETYYIYTQAFQKEICTGFDVKLTRRILKEKGILELDSDGSNKRCPYEVFKNKRMIKLVFRIT